MRYLVPLCILGAFASVFIGWALVVIYDHRRGRQDREEED